MRKDNRVFVLGIEGGGTKTTWAVIDAQERIVQQGVLGASNWAHLAPGELTRLLRCIRREAGSGFAAIGAAFAGCKLPAEKQAARDMIATVWPRVPRIEAGEDTVSAYRGALGHESGVCVIAGTGANVFGCARGRWEKAGGWGWLFGDAGSSYHLAQSGLRTAYTHFDQTGRITRLGNLFLQATAQNTFDEMNSWILAHSGKTEVAALARCVIQAAQERDPLARQVMQDGAEALAERVCWVSRRLKLRRFRVGLIGGLFENPTGYLEIFTRALRRHAPGARPFVNRTPGAIGAARMACGPLPASALPPSAAIASSALRKLDPILQRATTEQRNPRSRGLERMSTAQLVRLFIAEERWTVQGLRRAEKELVRAADLVAGTLQKGGRLFYVGAGTSGRLGVLDASEMPPTFNVAADRVQAIIAGGAGAVFRSAEGEEDRTERGAAAVRERGVSPHDVVVGITASGRTPFVLGALAAARRLGAETVLLSCNPAHPPCPDAAITVDLATGPELVSGSTRLKAGTATKLALNMLSTIAMIRGGRVRDNLMIAVQATNQKLRDRAVRLVMALTGCDFAEALSRLEAGRWNVVQAVDTTR